MNALHYILLIGAGYFGLQYLLAYNSIKNAKFEFSRLSIEGINLKEITLGVWLNIFNNSKNTITIQKIDLDLYLDGRYLGKLINPYPQMVAELSTNELVFVTTLNYSSVGNGLFEALKKGLDYPLTIKITGVAYTNGMAIPIPPINVYDINLKEILNNAN